MHDAAMLSKIYHVFDYLGSQKTAASLSTLAIYMQADGIHPIAIVHQTPAQFESFDLNEQTLTNKWCQLN